MKISGFQLHNSTVMPRDIQLQLFKRSFTTKGVGEESAHTA